MYKLRQISASELRGIFLIALGIAALIFYYAWWWQAEWWTSPWLILGFTIAVAYGVLQILASWIVYLGIHHQPSPPMVNVADWAVDVFVTAYKEDVEMIRRCLSAACAMRGAHKTWLLDDGGDPELARLAKELGAEYVTRSDRKDAKAGNLNALLPKTSSDVIAIFDIDHVPQPDYLEKTLPHFAEPEVGFVQTMPTFSNNKQGWVATAAVETSLDFYNPTSMGMNGMRSVTKMGTNSLIRRQALEEIGGYQPGLAEDLATSIRLHAAGWQSRYVAEPLAPGLAPPDLGAWFTQQAKWSRGVFEVFVADFPRLMAKLSWAQRTVYSVRMSNYMLGVVIFLHLAVLVGTLLFGDYSAKVGLQRYFLYLMPLGVMFIIIRGLALRKWRHISVQTTSIWRASVLIFNTWPVYTYTLAMALLRIPLSFKATPKSVSGRTHPAWIAPQLISILLLLSGLIYSWNNTADNWSLALLYAIAAGFILPQLGLLRTLLRPLFGLQERSTSAEYLADIH